MLSHARSIQLVLLGIVLSVVAILGHERLPARVMDLTAPDDGHGLYLIGSDADPAASKVRWVDARRLHFACEHPAGAAHPGCGLAFLFAGAQGAQGIDLRRFHSIDLDLAYRGKAHHVRVAVRNFDPRFSSEKDANSARIHSINLRTRDLAGPITLRLSELTVPEWWIGQYDLPRDYNLPSLDNATSLAIDVPGDVPGQVHELQVRRLALRGDWISSETLYLGILCAWLLGAALSVGARLVELRRQHQLQKQEIEALVARTAQLRSEQDALRQQVAIDELTGVLNRRGLEEALAATRGRGGEHAVIVVDIDHFKRINDSEGHDAGDQVLRRVAAVLAQNVRANDMLGRWGGEEFVIVCLDCNAEGAAGVAEKIRQRIEASSFAARQRTAVTASLGVSTLKEGEGFDEAFRRADAAMYLAKSTGRNRVVVDGAPVEARAIGNGDVA